MEALVALAMIAAYSVVVYMVGRLFTPQLGWVYGRRFGPRSDGKLMLHLWLAILPVGLGLAYWLISHLLGGVLFPEGWGAALLLAMFSPLPVMVGVSKRVNEYILEGYDQWRSVVVSEFLT